MTGPSSAPRGEHTPAPAVTWDPQLITTGEHVIYDPEDTTGQTGNTPLQPRPNRATRRAIARAARRKK